MPKSKSSLDNNNKSVFNFSNPRISLIIFEICSKWLSIVSFDEFANSSNFPFITANGVLISWDASWTKWICFSYASLTGFITFDAK